MTRRWRWDGGPERVAKRRRLSVVGTAVFACLVGVVGAGPATSEPVPPAASPGSTSAAPTACVPPGMPPLSELVTVGRHVMMAPVDGSDETVIVSAIGLATKDHLDRYHGGELPLDFIVYYVRGHLAAVDDHPGDPSEPDMVDIGMVSPSGAALAQGTPVCQWARLSRVPGAGRTTTRNDWI